MKYKWEGDISVLKDENQCEGGRKIIPKMFIFLMLDTLFIHRLEIRNRNISMKLENRKS